MPNPIVILWRFLTIAGATSPRLFAAPSGPSTVGLSSIPFAASSHRGLININLSVAQRQENVYISTYPSRLSPSSSVWQSRQLKRSDDHY
ncbi:hypothetical protein GE09DRAFT_1093944 [Coniochaeta sp. 2T2.1]|nr:hypothetical protein GE09DRAFT_1093944 [Coniochaeta sp. 2T2.1]